MHILLVRFSSMGDVVLQTATVNWLKSLYGEHISISFVTSKEFASLVENHSHVNKVFVYDRRGNESWSDFVKQIKAFHKTNPIDLILDVHATMRSLKLRMGLWTIPALTVDKRRWERFLLTKLKGVFFKRLISKKIFGLEPQVIRILNDIEKIFLDRRAAQKTIDFVKGKNHQLTSLGKLPEYEIEGEYVVLAPSASFDPKRWPISSFVELAKQMLMETNYKIVILAGPSDDFCEAFKGITDSRLLNLQGKTSLKESMSILSKAKFSIGNDSGMNHIAEAYGVACLTIFGPTDPRFGFAPHGIKSRYISKELWCKPCSTTGSKKCFRDRLYCMEEISVAEVMQTFKAMEQNNVHTL